MKKTALITGASDGIGMELARIHAANGDNLVIVARSENKLQQLKSELEKQYGIKVHVIARDLSEPDAAQRVFDETTQQSISVDYLINNAGFGDYGFFAETDFEKEQRMIQLNITALTQFTKIYLKDMLKKGSGRIMNVASTGAFQPAPTMAVYCATKAYVLSFSEAINNEVGNQGLSITALCPGATATGFEAAAAMESSKLFKGPQVASAKSVASYGYKAMMKGKAVAVHGVMNYIMVNSSRFAPRNLVVKIARWVLNKAH
ncbi:MAG: SDR family NAD(P)-dependent oxidoreductase [Chitinophagaceae bacterium]